MRGRRVFYVAVNSILILALSVVISLTGPVKSSPGTEVWVSPAILVDDTKGVGTTFKIEVWVSGVFDLFTYGFKVKWYAPILDASLLETGGFLERGGGTFPILKIFNTVDPVGEESYVSVGNSAIYTPPGVSGMGSLANITYTVQTKPGRTGILVYDIELMDSLGFPISVTVRHGYFSNERWSQTWMFVWKDASLTTTAKIRPGDVDNDTDCDIVDLMIVARAMGTNPSWPSGTGWSQWNFRADLDMDREVDPVDLSIAAVNYGRPYAGD